MRQRILITSAILEVYALLLASLQALGGVRTDEAKYLLTIPYPHPPLFRWMMHLTAFLPFQEMFWRVLLATLLVHSVWFVWEMGRSLHFPDRMAVCGGWLLSTGVILQAGSIMLAPIVVVEALVFLWLRSRKDLCTRIPGFIAVLWLASLFTAYQAVLFTPIVWSIVRYQQKSRLRTAAVVGTPIALLALYTVSNPLALATFVIHGTQGASRSVLERFSGAGTLWLIGGSVLVSVAGTWGILASRDRALVLTFLLIFAYDAFSIPFPFYAVLFTPLFVAGLLALFSGRHHPHSFPLLACFAASAAIMTSLFLPSRTPGPARATMTAIALRHQSGGIMISGSFGHDWQYESTFPVTRYTPAHLEDVQAIICLATCAPPLESLHWTMLPHVPVEVWVGR
ncbi:hypothetical protein HY213_01070 [Candidatus Peregrinibacteria bacterium]|nr:hypothetical protein [Candidatus Peregrinibacteria bacterium]